MYKIHCLNNISKSGLATLPDSYKIIEDMENADALLVRSFKMHELDLSSSVLAVARAGAGVNNIPLDNYAKKGVVVFNTPGANANAVKELTLAGMLIASRHINLGMKWIDDNSDDQDIQKSIEKAKKAFAGTEILGKTIGIIGLGAIGFKLAKSCAALGMNVLGYDRNLDVIKGETLPESMKIAKSNDEIYASSDFISLHLPLNEHTKHIINKKVMKQMKDGVVLLNFSRDQLVNDDDLKDFLTTGQIKAYVTDFPNHKTANMEHVIAIPHLGASTAEAEENCAIMAIDQIKNYLEYGMIKNSVNYPDINLTKKICKSRMVILYHSQTDMRETIVTDVIGDMPNVCHAYQAFKNGYGVIVLDIDAIVDPKLLLNLKDHQYITHVRII
jgi:D-3-phosphoglycerate dehydrogenase / 2-oxoglutarate reductase